MSTQSLFQTGFKFDTADFEKHIAEYIASMPGACKEAIQEALVQLRDDAENISPTIPHDKGDLRQEVDLISTPSEGQIVFKMPYATRQHESEHKNYSEPGSGPKYIESKLANRGQTYGRIMANRIKEETGA